MTRLAPPSRFGRVGPLLVPLYLGFFLTGIVTVLLGPLIPELRAKWQISPSEAGLLFLAQFVSSSVGAVLSSLYLQQSVIVGYFLIAVGLLALANSHWPLALAAMALIGLGLGLAIPATNLLVALENPRRRGASLSALNLVWGLGAVSCPLVFAALMTRGLGGSSALWALAGLVGLLWVWLVATSQELGRAPAPTDPSPPLARSGRSLVPLLFLAAMLFLYVGVENAVGGWLVALSDQIADERSVVSMLIDSGFWGALLGGRAVAPLLLRRLTEPALHKACLLLAGVGTLGILLAGSRGGIAVGAVLTGAGLAPLFPLTVSILTAHTVSSRSRETGWVFACAGLGGAFLPWATGRVTAASGSLSHGFAVPLAGLALLTTLFVLYRALFAREAPIRGAPVAASSHADTT